MRLTVKLALRNLLSAGLRTWLNIFVLSVTFVLLLWGQALYDGMGKQALDLKTAYEVAGGQYWASGYDPYDPLGFDKAHQPIPSSLQALIDQDLATPILIQPATAYPKGRLQPIVLRGIKPSQTVVEIPTHVLEASSQPIPALIGERMAAALDVQQGAVMTVRWRDHQGVFDATEIKIVQIMSVNVPTIDGGQIWVPFEAMQAMMGLTNEATMITVRSPDLPQHEAPGWTFKDDYFLLEDVRTWIAQEKVGSWFMYAMMMFLALISVFDAQILSVFKRRKEIGTLIALGMTQKQVIRLFTLEGSLNGILAMGLGAIWGTPICIYTAKKGITFDMQADQFGLALSNTIFPSFTLKLTVLTIVIIAGAVTLISFIPTRQIARLKPTDAITGRRVQT